MNKDMNDALWWRYIEWRSFEDDPDTEPESTRGLDRRASFQEWLDAQTPRSKRAPCGGHFPSTPSRRVSPPAKPPFLSL